MAERDYANYASLPLEVDADYDLNTFLRGALDLGKDRCLFCYRMRLEKTFKKGVEEQAGREDSDTHYNLGIAYKEMGLLDEAIAEFLLTREGCFRQHGYEDDNGRRSARSG